MSLTKYVEELNQSGFTVMHDIYTSTDIEDMKQAYTEIRNKANDILNTTCAYERRWYENDQETVSKYWKYKEYSSSSSSSNSVLQAVEEQFMTKTTTQMGMGKNCIILQAGEDRYDLWKGFADQIPDHILSNTYIEELMKKLLLNNYAKYSGVIMSNPGSKDQYFHRDTDCLQNLGSDGRLLVQLDPFYYTVLIPISVDMTIMNGTTEFMVGSHLKPSSEFDGLPLMQSVVPVGSAVIFDGKINHRGKANNSNDERPCIYQVYHKRWYNDQFRTGVCED